MALTIKNLDDVEQNRGDRSSSSASPPNILPSSSIDQSSLPVESILEPIAESAVELVVDLGDRKLYVYTAGELTTSYPIAIGRAGWETPTGEFSVIRMQANPHWEHPFQDIVIPPGEQNPLGSRWIGFWTDGVNTVGFHGTPNRESVGRPASHGCVRMYDEDVIALFEQVEVGTLVRVIP